MLSNIVEETSDDVEHGLWSEGGSEADDGDRKQQVVAMLQDEGAARLPPRKEWVNCCVPMHLLLEEYDLKMKRRGLKRECCVYLCCLVLVLAISLTTFVGIETSVVYVSAEAGLQVVSQALIAETGILLNRPDEVQGLTFAPTISPTLAPSSSPTVAPSLSPTVSPTLSLAPTGAPLVNATVSPSTSPSRIPTRSPTTKSPTPSPTTLAPTTKAPTVVVESSDLRYLYPISYLISGFQLFSVDSFLEFYSQQVYFVLCQPDSPMGNCIEVSTVIQKRATVHVGTTAGANQATCLAQRDWSSYYFDDPNYYCQYVPLESGPSEGHCFPGYDDSMESNYLNTFWANQAPANQVEGPLTLSDSCLYVQFGQFSSCFLANEDWFSRDISLGIHDFKSRIEDVEFLTTRSIMSEREAMALQGNIPTSRYAWLDSNSKSFDSIFVVTSEQTQTILVLRIGVEQTLAGNVVVREHVLAASTLTSMVTENGSLTGQAAVMFVFAVLLILIVLVDLFYNVIKLCCGDNSFTTVIVVHFRHISVWNIIDLILVILYIMLLVRLTWFGVQNSSLFTIAQSVCGAEQIVVQVTHVRQLLGGILFLLIVRLIKYLSLFPQLELIWTALREGLFYYMFPFFLLMLLVLTFAFCNMVVMHVYKVEFADYYNAVVSMLLLYGDGGSASLEGLMQPLTLGRTNIPGIQFYLLVWIFKFFVVYPFTAMAVSVFYYAVVFTTREYRNKVEQRKLEKKASLAQATLSRLQQDTMESSLGTGAGGAGGKHAIVMPAYETRLKNIISSTDMVDDDAGYRASKSTGPTLKSQLATGCSNVKVGCQACWYRTKRFFVGSSDKSNTSFGRFGRSKQKTVTDHEALFRLKIFAAKPENENRVFITFDEIEQVVGSSSQEQILDIMSIVSEGNIYENQVKRKYDADILSRRSRGEKVLLPTSLEIAEQEKRRAKLSMDTLSVTQEFGEESKIVEMSDRLKKLESTSDVATSILLVEFDDIINQQRVAIHQMKQSLHSLQVVKTKIYQDANRSPML